MSRSRPMPNRVLKLRGVPRDAGRSPVSSPTQGALRAGERRQGSDRKAPRRSGRPLRTWIVDTSTSADVTRFGDDIGSIFQTRGRAGSATPLRPGGRACQSAARCAGRASGGNAGSRDSTETKTAAILTPRRSATEPARRSRGAEEQVEVGGEQVEAVRTKAAHAFQLAAEIAEYRAELRPTPTP